MKTSVMKVHDMLSVLSVSGVEERIGEVPGVESVTVDFAAGSATVRFDETRLTLADIRSSVRQSGSQDDAADDGGEDPEASEKPVAPSADIKPAAIKAPPTAASADASPPGTPKPAPEAAAKPEAVPADKVAMKGMKGMPDNH